MSRLKVGVVGVGALGRHHARILSSFDDVDLTAVVDTDPQRCRKAAEDYGGAPATDYREILDDVEAVSVAVPTVLHRLVAGQFLSRGIPVLVEKPLAANLEDAEALVHLAEQSQTLLQVGHVERFNPATRAAWPLCGPPKYIRAERLSPYSFRSTDIGVVHDLMIHDLDLVLELVQSPIRDVEAFGISVLGGHEDSAQARVRFENGCIADLTANRVCPVARRTMQVWSHRGCVTVDFSSREVCSYRASETLLYGVSPAERARQPNADVDKLKAEVFGTFLKVSRPPVPAVDALTAELRHFVECVRERRRPLVDGHSALRAMQAADRVLDSLAAHQWDGHAAGAVGPFVRFPRERRLAG